ncbi:MAG: PilZ domain-containing protein [Oligoflexia bacterium]|nr:PilZ domain-containing protein [Oligoflexia bacterium]
MNKLIQNKHVDIENFVYSLNEKKWFQLGDIKEFAFYLPSKPEAPIEKPIFFIYINDIVAGPFTKGEIEDKFKRGDLNSYDYVFNQEIGIWKRIKHSPIFIDILPRPPTLIPYVPETEKLHNANGTRINNNFSSTSTSPSAPTETYSKLNDPIDIDNELTEFTGKTDRHAMYTNSSSLIEFGEQNIFDEDIMNIKALVIKDLPFDSENIDAAKMQIAKKQKGTTNKRNNEVKEVKAKEMIASKNNTSVTNVNSEIISSNAFEIKNDPVWVINKGEKHLGPFCYLEVLKMLQKNVISKETHIKKKNSNEWKKIEEIYEYNTDIIRKIVTDKGKIVEKIFVPRKHKRTSYLGPAAISYKGKIYRGTCSSISEGGCFIEMRPSDFELGDEIHLKIMPGTVPLTVEGTGKVVSINERGPKGIGIKFTNLDSEQIEEVRKIVERYSIQLGN